MISRTGNGKKRSVGYFRGITFGRIGNVDILTQFDIALCTYNNRTAVAPGTQAIGGKPVDPEITGNTVIAHEHGIAEVLELGIFLVGIVAHTALDDFRVFRTGEVQDLLDLVAGERTGGALTSISRSVESHLAALAAEESRLNGGKVIDI